MDHQGPTRGRRMAVALLLALAIFLANPLPGGAAGWTNLWSASNNTMYWMNNGNWRLAYTYGAGQWWDCTQLGGKDNWNTLGSTGQSPNFLGNASIGWYLPVGNGWYYGYDTRSDCGYWENSSGNFRFGYQYGSGQWWDQNLNQWNQIGAASVQSPFVGDGSLHDMKNAWSYEYLVSNDTGYWVTGGNFRLAYGYYAGMWFDNSNTWRALSSTGVGSAFIGNAAIGAYYYMNNNWYYGYNVNQNIGYWKASTGPFRFGYYYPGGIWYDEGNTGGWATLGSAGLSSAFLGDGSLDNLKNGWSYYYNRSDDIGYWYDGTTYRFGFGYGAGQWYNQGGNPGTGATLGSPGLSSAFLGDGYWHTLDSIWSYGYVSGIGYLKGSVSTWVPGSTGDVGSWSSSPWQVTCNYQTQVLGLYDSSSTSSVFLYDYNGGSAYSGKWMDWNYNISNKSEISAATVFYTGSTTHDASSWLSWLPVNPTPGFITRTETWDFTSPEYAIDGIHAHSVRAFWNNQWVVQNEQGSRNDCTLVAALDALEQVTGLYWDMGQTMILAKNNSWLNSDYSSMPLGSISPLYRALGQGTVSVNCVAGSNLAALTNWTNAGNPVIVAVDLGDMPSFGSYPSGSGHALVFHGVDGSGNDEITNGWNIQSNTTQIVGTNPVSAYPITLISQTQFRSGWDKYGGDWAVFVRK